MAIRSIMGLLLLMGLLFSTHASGTNSQDIQTVTLKNGMKILILEDHSIPNANMYLFWKVGSRNEYPGITGLSHFFEHMMFNGAKKYGPKMFDQVMEAAGGANNAYTTEDITVYTDWFPKEALEKIFDLEADRIQHLKIDSEVVESERGVVVSERSTGLENSNLQTLFEEVKGAAFRAHPYSWPVIGHESDINNWHLNDLVEYHKTYYAPNNAVVVITGDVTVAEVMRLAKRYFEPIPKGKEPRKVHTIEPPQKGEKRVYVHKASATSANILMGWHTPQAKHKDYYALDVLASILSDGDSSRLKKYLVQQQQLATSVFAYYPMSIDPNLFYIYGVAAQDKTAQQLERGIIKVINEIIAQGISEKELDKIKNQRQVDFYRTMATINGKADTIGTYEIYFDDYKALFDAPKEYAKITVADVQRVAKEYLIKAKRTVGVLTNKEDSHEGDL